MFRNDILSLFFGFVSTKMMSNIEYGGLGKNIIYITKPNKPPPPHKNFQEGEFRQAVWQYGEFGKKQLT